MAFSGLGEQVVSLGFRLRLLAMAFRRVDRIPAGVLISLAAEEPSRSSAAGELSAWEVQVLDRYLPRG
jgi:hypothetical protein